MSLTEPMRKAYVVLRAAGRGDDAGITALDLESHCNSKYGARCKDYWSKQLEALADMGYAEKTNRIEAKKQARRVVWVAADPWGEL